MQSLFEIRDPTEWIHTQKHTHVGSEQVAFRQNQTTAMATTTTKTIQQRAEEVEFQEMLAGDMMRQMRIADDPVACSKFRADLAAGDIGKYSPISGVSEREGFDQYGDGLEGTLNSPTKVRNQCAFCERFPPKGTQLLQCSRCKHVRYCDKVCQKRDWRFHKKGCTLLLSNPKGL